MSIHVNIWVIKPLGGDNAPLQKQQHRPSRPIPIASDNNNNGSTSSSSNSSNNNNNDANRLASLAVPSRLPQKRQATESSTNLVEKLRVPQPEVGERSQSYHKKSRLIDYEWQDLDEEDSDDQLMVSEYVNEIFSYYYELETRMLPDPQYLFKQTLLKPRMRSILVDWLVEMHLKFKLLPESLFLAVNVMDRFMSVEVVQIDKLQLLATAALFTAAKYEEVFSPSVKNYAYFTDGSYTPEERISKADDYDVQSRTLGKYLLEITIVDYKFIGMRPSLCCASAMYLARLILGKLPVWNGNLIHYSGGYRISDMRECIELMFQYLIAPIEHDEFFKKYAMRKFMRASTLCRNWAKKFQASGRDLFDERLSTHRLTLEDDDEEEEIVVAEAEE
ncbi:Cyclin, N-terminal domain family protein [Candida albicans]|uniref:Cyclin, N-terminal domain family protein n=1 Tax=Candida albicans TaxID=5476 RepID=A0A8H6BVC0_CANAX|nr:Cyclin, N-terminal domain family protein [Candida albicans]